MARIHTNMKTPGLLDKLVTSCFVISTIALVTMMLATVSDVFMANTFRRPIIGTFDFVETTLVLMVFLGFPATFRDNSHIAVDVVDLLASPATLARLKLLGKLCSMIFLGFLAWQMIEPAHDAFKYGERKQELGLPLYLLWIPMIFGIAVSAVMALMSVFKAEAQANEKGKP